MTGSGLAWFVAWLFARAATHKIRAPGYYRVLMGQYLGTYTSTAAVCLLGATEAVLAVSVLLPYSRRLSLAVAVLLLLFYAGLMALRILRGDADMQCGCSGPGSPLQVSWALVLRNLVCAGLALLAFGLAETSASSWLRVAGAFVVALAAIAAYLFCEALISNAQFMAGED